MKKVILTLMVCLLCGPFISGKDSNNDYSIRIAQYRHDKTCAISYTFDDGMKEHYTLVIPQLEKHNFKGTFWVCGQFSENKGERNLSWEEIKEMDQLGHEISNHTWSHKNLTEITAEAVKEEIEKNDNILQEKLGRRPKTFCYPYNAFNQTAYDIASVNRIATRTEQRAIGTRSTAENLDKWIERLLILKEWGIAMIHGITYGYDAFESPSILWDHFEQVKSLEHQIWVATFCEVASYQKQRENIKWQAREKKNGLTILPELALDKELFNTPLTMIIEKEEIQEATIIQGNKKQIAEVQSGKIIFDFDPYGGLIEVNW